LDEEVWKEVNPSLGTTITMDYLRKEAEKAKEVPSYQNTFRRLHLNQWTEAAERWLDVGLWDESAGLVEAERLEGHKCYGGLDLASTYDLAAFVLVFPEDEGFEILPFFWIPEENMVERSHKDKVPYTSWARQGFITPTEGNVIDYTRIRQKIEDLGKVYNIAEIAFDRWGAVQMSQELEGAGFTLVPFGQGFKDMSPPTKELLRLVIEKRLIHSGNPVLRWMASNLAVRTDPAGNVKPDKQKSSEKIDGIVALIMALDRALRHEEMKESIYETSGLLTF
jgi:phage terminase large subunit-like protein